MVEEKWKYFVDSNLLRSVRNKRSKGSMELYWKDLVFKYISRANSGSRIWSKVVDLVGVMMWLHQNDKPAAASPTFIVVFVLHQESITSVYKLNLCIELK